MTKSYISCNLKDFTVVMNMCLIYVNFSLIGFNEDMFLLIRSGNIRELEYE